ncbi:MAP7 domain-containing protein 1-like isoform X4 [Acanthaster planci]|uniref:MAP7 domain-containing protein 1-like isoform X4 n=1 Tax=Acanthaster planci TaxID=133434 RepID=A0A8B7XNS4_ACAPL|nr:MAP7 domain-containing protein 1-like isoform X4 [Acanthaster planci]
MADNTGVDDGPFQPKSESEAITLTNADAPADSTDPGATVNPFQSSESPPVIPSDPITNPAPDSPQQDFSEPPQCLPQSNAAPVLLVTGETASNGDLDSSEPDTPYPEGQAGSDIVGNSSDSSVSENAKVKADGSVDPSSELTSESNGDRSRQDSGSTEGSRRDGPPTRSRAQPVLDASKLKEKENKNNQFRQQQLSDRQKRIDSIRHKATDHRAEILERKKKQEEEDQARKEAIVRRSRERSDNAREKRRSWSAFGSRDYSSPVPSGGTPRSSRGRSTDRMTERQSPDGSLTLGASKRLSSSVSALHRPVHLVRLGPNEDDWFEVHIPDPRSRRGSSPGNDKNPDSSSTPLPASSSTIPRHHLSSPNLASYPNRDSRSAHSTPTHVSRPLSATKRSNSNSKLDSESGPVGGKPASGTAPAKRGTSPRTSLHGRPPSPRQQSSTPRATPVRAPSPKTAAGQGSTTVDGSKPRPGRVQSPRNLPKQTNGDSSRKPPEGKKTPGQAPPIKKALTPRTDIVKSTVSSPTRTVTAPKSTPKAPATKPATTPKGGPKQAKPAAVKVAVAAAAAPEKPAPEKPAPAKEEVEPETKPKETPRSQSPTISESSSGSAPAANGTASPAAQAPPPAKELTEEERAKQALAERRRQAREKAEREAELEKQRQEQLKREEEERIRREEEERIRQEEEELRLAEEHRKAEEERLKQAIQEKEEKERLEAERKAAEEAEAALRAEEERLRQEDLKRQEEELAEKCRREDEERNARKKRVEEIMKRARRGAQAKDKDDGSENGDSGSESGSATGSERKTNGVNSMLASSSVLNSEKYRNLLFNRNKTELSGDEDEDYEGGQLEGTANGGPANSSSDSDDRDGMELGGGAGPVDLLPGDKPEWSDEEAKQVDGEDFMEVLDSDAGFQGDINVLERGVVMEDDLQEKQELPTEPADGIGVGNGEVSDKGVAKEEDAAEMEGVAREEDVAEVEGVAKEEDVAKMEGVAREEDVAEVEGVAKEEDVAKMEGVAREEDVAEVEGVAREEDVAEVVGVAKERPELKGPAEEPPPPLDDDDVVSDDAVGALGVGKEGAVEQVVANEGTDSKGFTDQPLLDDYGIGKDAVTDEGFVKEEGVVEDVADKETASKVFTEQQPPFDNYGVSSDVVTDEGVVEEGGADTEADSDTFTEQPASKDYGIGSDEISDGVVKEHVAKEEVNSEVVIEQQPRFDDCSVDSDAVADVGVASEEGVVKEDIPVDLTTNGNGNIDPEDQEDISSDDEKSDGSSRNGNELEPPGLTAPPLNNVPASDNNFNNANGETLIDPAPESTELITKKALLDFDDGGGTLDDGGTIEMGQELSPDSASDKLNANLGMMAGFPVGDAPTTLSFSPMGELESNGGQQPQPMAVCLTPEGTTPTCDIHGPCFWHDCLTDVL